MAYSATPASAQCACAIALLRDCFVNFLNIVDAVGRGHHDGRIVRSHGATCLGGDGTMANDPLQDTKERLLLEGQKAYIIINAAGALTLLAFLQAIWPNAG